MKTYLLATCLAVAPGLARAEPHCSLPPPLPAAETTNPLRELPSAEATPRVLAQAAPALPLAAPAVTLPPSDPARRSAGTAATLPPALQHIAATGAAITDMGDYHGLRRVVARTGDQFMLLSATPDGQAVVAGLMSDLSAADLSQIAGGSLTELGMLHGLRGLLVKSGTQFQVFYATPDGERVVPGVMWDAAGKNLTRDQVAPVAGIVPTVTIGPAANAVPQSTAFSGAPAPQPVPALNIVQATSFGTIGSPSAPRLWMFIDPLCSFSVRAMQQLQPFVAERARAASGDPARGDRSRDQWPQHDQCPCHAEQADRPNGHGLEPWRPRRSSDPGSDCAPAGQHGGRSGDPS